jgi:hypothetical protein
MRLPQALGLLRRVQLQRARQRWKHSDPQQVQRRQGPTRPLVRLVRHREARPQPARLQAA